MDAITTDWLHQQDLENWRRRIRQLHRELFEERMQPQKPQTISEGVTDKDTAQSAKPLRRFKSSEY